MYTILIVDDDFLSRTQIKELMNFEEFGYEIIGEAKNGTEAIEFVNEKRPDIVITDISMPNVSGIELIGYLRKNYPAIVVIALSAFDNFQYVRDGMKYGAKDYLLKHNLTAKNLEKALKEAVSGKSLSENGSGSQASLHNFLRYLLFSGEKNADYIEKESLELGIEFSGGAICVVFSYDVPKGKSESINRKDRNFYLKSVDNIISETLASGKGVYFVRFNNEDAALLFTFENVLGRKAINYEIDKFLQRIRRNIKLFLNIEIFFGVSDLCYESLRFSEIYSEAEERLHLRFLSPETSVFKTAVIRDDSPITLTDEDRIELKNSIKQKDQSAYLAHINRFFNQIKSRFSQFACIQAFCYELFKILEAIANKNGLRLSDLYRVEEIPYFKRETDVNLEEIRAWFCEIGEKIMEFIDESFIDQQYSKATQQALKFVHQHFAENISLSDAARHSGFNSSYVSRVFKEDTGVNFVRYLNEYRINRAIELMKNDGDDRKMILNDVASAVGFHNYNHFLSVFRNITGYLPEIYLKKIM